MKYILQEGEKFLDQKVYYGESGSSRNPITLGTTTKGALISCSRNGEWREMIISEVPLLNTSQDPDSKKIKLTKGTDTKRCLHWVDGVIFQGIFIEEKLSEILQEFSRKYEEYKEGLSDGNDGNANLVLR